METDAGGTRPSETVKPTEAVERGALTGSGALQAIAQSVASGAAGAAAGAVTTKLLNRPKKAQPKPESKIVLPPKSRHE
jgi:hypothetical protein